MNVILKVTGVKYCKKLLCIHTHLYVSIHAHTYNIHAHRCIKFVCIYGYEKQKRQLTKIWFPVIISEWCDLVTLSPLFFSVFYNFSFTFKGEKVKGQDGNFLNYGLISRGFSQNAPHPSVLRLRPLSLRTGRGLLSEKETL